MRHFYLVLAAAFIGLSSSAQILKQDFTSSTTITDYVNAATPGNDKFSGINDGGNGMDLSVPTGTLQFAKTGNADGSFVRTFGTQSVLMYQFDLNISAITTTGTSNLHFYFGNGFTNTGTGTETVGGSTVNAYFRVDFTNTASGLYRFRSAANIQNTTDFSGNNRVMFVINNTASSITYTAPNGSLTTAAANTSDLWVGNTNLFNDNALSASAVTINAFKFVIEEGSGGGTAGRGTVAFDNFLVDPAPAAPTVSAPAYVSPTSFQAKWVASSNTAVTGYRLDVATNATFTSFVPGYNNKYIAGINTTADVVTGVTNGNQYYYRVRAVEQYGSNEIGGDANATANIGAILPIKLSSFTGSIKNKKAELVWVTELESHSDRYEVERSTDGKTFSKVGTVTANGKASTYNFSDATIGAGKSFYRLRSVDIDGKYEFSHTVMINNKGIAVVDIYPNPVVGTVTVQYPKVETNTVLNIVSINGAKVKSFVLPANSTQSKISVDHLQTGSYILVYDNGVERITTKFTKQ